MGSHPGLQITKRCTRLAAASDKVYQLLAHGRWFSPGTPASSATKTGRHDIAEILLKVALSIKNQIKNILRYDFDYICTFFFLFISCFIEVYFFSIEILLYIGHSNWCFSLALKIIRIE